MKSHEGGAIIGDRRRASKSGARLAGGFAPLACRGFLLAGAMQFSVPALAQEAADTNIVSVSDAADRCEALVGLHFGPAIVKETALVAATGSKPEYCEVLAYQAGKPIHQMRAFLPTQWRGGMLHAGTGGFKGSLRPEEALWNVSTPTQRGMVYLSGNGGHDDPSGLKLANPENMRDYVYRNIGTVYDFGRAVVRAYYGADPSENLFMGCSGGGQEAYQAASIYPQNYDGIISQAGPPSRIGWITRVGPLYVLEPLRITQWADIYRSYIAQCDGLDGAEDGVVSFPGACNFDPTTVADWTPRQLETINFIYNPIYSANGELLAQKTGFGLSRFAGFGHYSDVWGKTLFARGENYDPSQYDQEHYLPQIISSTQQYGFNLDPVAVAGYLKQGGRLLIQHGLDDGGVSPFSTRVFADNVRQAAGGAADNLEVQFIPGVGHCGNKMSGVPEGQEAEAAAYLRRWGRGGADDDLSQLLPGADMMESLGFMQRWVETGAAPSSLTVERRRPDGSVEFSRPVCTSGSYPRYRGSGDVRRAENFECVADPRAL